MLLYGAEDHLMTVTDAINADLHRHSFIQVSVALDSPFQIAVGGEPFYCEGLVINSNVKHHLDGQKKRMLLLLICNTSQLAQAFKKKLDGQPFYLLSSREVKSLSAHVLDGSKSITGAESYSPFLGHLLKLLAVSYEEPVITDPRVTEVIRIIRKCSSDEHGIDKLAEQVHLSPSRLSHLFKENTGMALSGYLLMHKLQKAVYLVFSGKTITEAALSAGFDSPSHLAAVSKSRLGMSARDISKDSVFLKVSH